MKLFFLSWKRRSSRFYAQCFGHQTKIQACAEGLWYNEQSGLCDYKERVPICGGSIPTGPAQSPPTTATASSYGYNVQQTGFSCQGKANGYYSKGCAQSYYSCISGNTHAVGGFVIFSKGIDRICR